ncbi:hypothetical protein [Vitreoscilla stercoraria]|uniref:Uncharacterized protein n=1 Tax=Vitreoscilla stercoraria TaxID=61 RepID=A0ABY4EAK1_VITST|nr:hypothetical protein [Vitreoscilla stercoraria]UOO92316.1 hypothetical protein LVJ81_11985 [Vitreoscilla stercoraria]
MSQHNSKTQPIHIGQHIVRSIYGMFLLLEPPDATVLKAHTVDIATLAWRLPCAWSQWIFDDGISHKRLLWLGCPRGDDMVLFEQRMCDVVAHFKITTYASILLTADCVSVSLHQNGEKQVWFSPGGFLTVEWQQDLLSQLFGSPNHLLHLRELSAHGAIAEPQTNAGRMARQLKAQQLWRDLSWDKTSVL